MKGFAMLGPNKTGFIEKEDPKVGSRDALVRPLAVAPCTSDIHTVFEDALGPRENMILGHEACGVVVEVGEDVKDFKPGDRVLVPAITPNWSDVYSQLATPLIPTGCWAAGSSLISRTGSSPLVSTLTTPTGTWLTYRMKLTRPRPACFPT
ncbi:alcohol dehydrogenase catalytic domain-containing protein [Limosilactobacillus fermentum]|nr:alcohol dehydrogenase catalytic domain-containing protein [Limosilactobacillus fermentum]